MAFFVQAASSALYLASTNGDNAGALAFVLGVNVPATEKEIELSEALSSISLGGIFVFCPQALNYHDDSDTQAAFVTAVQNIAARQAASRGILWLATPDIDALAQSTTPIWLGLTDDGSSVASGLANANILPNMTLFVPNGMKVSLANTTLTLSNGKITFTGGAAPQMTKAVTASLPFAGINRSCISFNTAIRRSSLYDDWHWGFHFLFATESAFDGFTSEWLPLASGSDGAADMLNFTANFDPANPLNITETLNNRNHNRSGLLFDGTNQSTQPTRLQSFYVTVTGDAVTLTPVTGGQGNVQPAGLVFSLGRRVSESEMDFHAAPFGDFLISTRPGPNGISAEILCGLSGSEFISITQGFTLESASRLRFVSGQGAYAQTFPPPAASPVAAPNDSTTLLSNDYVTSWVTVLPAMGKFNAYAAQPDGAALFGYDDIVWQQNPSMLGHVDPGYVLSQQGPAPFPLVPYSGFQPGDGVNQFNQQQSRQFETLIIGPTRRKAIGNKTLSQALSVRRRVAGLSPCQSSLPGENMLNFTTPSGVIASLNRGNQQGAWEKILLGQVVTPKVKELAFVNPSPELQQAFQTNQLLLVAANSNSFVNEAGHFANQLNIGDWVIEADVGASLDYGNYANVMIVKNIPGPLWDPDGNVDDNLIANPAKWTQAETFAAPTMKPGETPDQQQMVNLSQWLQDYFAAAFAEDDQDFFGRFCQIARDPNWTGILVLRARIAKVPDDLAGITAGIRNTDRFFAHHLAVEISQITSDPQGEGIQIEKQSSVYGLIHYIDSDYDSSSEGSPVTPAYGEDYDFITLTLKVLFENTSVKQFSSFTQLTLNKVFGSAVTGMEEGGNQYNSIIMSGSFQNNSGRLTYGMKTLSDYCFQFDNNVLCAVETVSAAMNTVRSDETETQIRFDLTGYLSFHKLQVSDPDEDGEDFHTDDEAGTVDFYSFGPEGEQWGPRTGLNYSNLGLNMAFKTPDPLNTRHITFDSSQITFNMAASVARAGSLFDSLSMELMGMVSADESDVTPESLGYLDVVTNIRMGGVTDGWHGLQFRLNLGTAGELAGKAGLNAVLLLAWAPDSSGESYQASTGLKMPGTTNGAPLISLQSVIALSYGTIQLLYTDKPGQMLHPTSRKPLRLQAVQGGGVPARSSGKSTVAGKQFILVLNEIAIKFFGILKIPPNGSTAFYLFGDADGGASRTGLAWYAVYNNEPKATGDNVAPCLTDKGECK